MIVRRMYIMMALRIPPAAGLSPFNHYTTILFVSTRCALLFSILLVLERT